MVLRTCENKVLVPRIGLEAIVNEARIGDVRMNRGFFAFGRKHLDDLFVITGP
jgi:hypothetical protein